MLLLIGQKKESINSLCLLYLLHVGMASEHGVGIHVVAFH